jgi:PEP-CTERM motif
LMILASAPALAIPVGSSAPTQDAPFRVFTQQMTGALGAFASYWQTSPQIAPVSGGTTCSACGTGSGFVGIAVSLLPIGLPAQPADDLPLPPRPATAVDALCAQPSAVPEPASLALVAVGLAALARRKQT